MESNYRLICTSEGGDRGPAWRGVMRAQPSNKYKDRKPSLTGDPIPPPSAAAATRGANCGCASADPSVIDGYMNVYSLGGRVGGGRNTLQT